MNPDCCCNIPDKMLAWPLFGAGMEKLGKDDQPCWVPVPEPGKDELLVRIDAIGLCFSDVKLIRAGETHPRVVSSNLTEDPVIPGHEAVMTVVKVGDQLKDRYRCGQRFIIQADIYVNGKGYAYGYAINGGMAQYSIIDQRILNGDEGCYLLPISEQLPTAIAALMEPWTCVQASYMIENRARPRQGGKVLLVAEPGSSKIYQAGARLQQAGPASVSVLNLSPESVDALWAELSVEPEILSSLPEPGEAGFDDIFICVCGRELAERAGKLGNRGAVISFIGEYPDESWAFDIGSIHYEGWYYQGTASAVLSDAYDRNLRSTLKRGGSCWLPGGAGAMGQMHTQMAVKSPHGPSRILVSDMDDARIRNVRKLLAADIAARGIEFETVNPGKMTPAEFEKAVTRFAPHGFDDIVMLVPVIPVLNAAARFLKPGGLMNIFAGIPAGKEGELNINGIANRDIRYIGSSGSRTEHLRHTLELAEEGALKPVTALAAVGGMKVLKKGLDAVINASFPGKTVIFPNCPEMPLTQVDKLTDLLPEVAKTLDDEGFYTRATEDVLLQKYSR